MSASRRCRIGFMLVWYRFDIGWYDIGFISVTYRIHRMDSGFTSESRRFDDGFTPGSYRFHIAFILASYPFDVVRCFHFGFTVNTMYVSFKLVSYQFHVGLMEES